MDKKEVLFKFETEEQCENFIAWFSNSGEQDYFQAGEEQEECDSVNHFDYDDENNIINGETIADEIEPEINLE